MWKCKCHYNNCNNIIETYSSALRNNSQISCGCKKVKHGKRHTRIYSIWNGMKMRCLNKNNPSYKKYGDKGIKICEEWEKSFESFYDWAINNGYNDSLTIDRWPNKNGPYSPDNCRWATQKEQQNNRTNNHKCKYLNKEYTLSELESAFNIEASLIRSRLERGWSIEDSIKIPKKNKKKEDINGI